jgi:2-amino-4-hydroxy-6-hydroxymethyldihydropteridine diphosphokinase
MIATGSNLGDSVQTLCSAKTLLSEHFLFIGESRIYKSAAVDYLDQPCFFNQVLEFEIPDLSTEEVMSTLLSIEKTLGRERIIDKGPRIIDIDLLFYGLAECESEHVTLPHPRLFKRSFVVRPLSELPYFAILKQHYKFNFSFDIDAHPI